MLLAIDVGNTNIVIGVFQEDQLEDSWRIQTLRGRTADEFGLQILQLLEHHQVDTSKISDIILSSVVPPLTGTFVDMATRYFHRTPITIDEGVKTGMPVLYDNPADVGADRIVNGVAAYELFGRQGPDPLIVVDFGTATTFDAISSRGEYLGGVICPGIEISADALFQRAARLPRVDVRKPPRLIGRTTVGSMQSGLFYGYVAMVEGLVTRLRAELSRLESGAPDREPWTVPCIATGGLATVISSETEIIDRVEPELTLLGLRMIWHRNQ